MNEHDENSANPQPEVKLKKFKIFLPFLMIGCGLFALRRAFHEYHKWQTELLIDKSNAEFYEITFYFWGAPAIALIVTGSFLAGRWLFARK